MLRLMLPKGILLPTAELKAPLPSLCFICRWRTSGSYITASAAIGHQRDKPAVLLFSFRRVSQMLAVLNPLVSCIELQFHQILAGGMLAHCGIV